jgi:3'(2'), 5'-bisphosphate nucleotidase
MDYKSLISPMNKIALDAGRMIMSHFGNVEISSKADKSPVTNADKQANAYIEAQLQKLSFLPIVSEENSENHYSGFKPKDFFLVDPLDGTKAFIRGEKNFTVNIALILDNQPVLGVIFAPAHLDLYYVGENGKAYHSKTPGFEMSFSEKLEVSDGLLDGINVIASSAHLDGNSKAFIDTVKPAKTDNISSSLKFCLLADGSYHLYPRFAPTMEWDIAAGHAILNAAGGKILCPNGDLLYGNLYGETRPFQSPNFLAFSNKPNISKWTRKLHNF